METTRTTLAAKVGTESKQKHECFNPPCSKKGKSRCTRCKSAWYCGTECQLEHYPLHKKPCRAESKAKEQGKKKSSKSSKNKGKGKSKSKQEDGGGEKKIICKFFNMPPVEKKYVQRPEVLDEVSTKVDKSNVVIVSGLGGVGKTSLTNSFVHNSNAHNYIAIIHLNASSLAKLEQECIKVVMKDFNLTDYNPEAHGSAISVLIRHIMSYTTPTTRALIVYDNADRLSVLKDNLPLPEMLPRVNVLITTRASLERFNKSEDIWIKGDATNFVSLLRLSKKAARKVWRSFKKNRENIVCGIFYPRL